MAIGTSPVAPCQKQTFTVAPNHQITNGYFQSPDWCLHLDNCTSKPAYQECDLTPVSPDPPGTLPSAQRNKIKLVRKFGEGDSLCFIYSYCRISEEGMYVLCRKKPTAFVEDFLALVQFVVNSLIPSLPQLTVVNQTNCTFANSCPP